MRRSLLLRTDAINNKMKKASPELKNFPEIASRITRYHCPYPWELLTMPCQTKNAYSHGVDTRLVMTTEAKSFPSCGSRRYVEFVLASRRQNAKIPKRQVWPFGTYNSVGRVASPEGKIQGADFWTLKGNIGGFQYGICVSDEKICFCAHRTKSSLEFDK